MQFGKQSDTWRGPCSSSDTDIHILKRLWVLFSEWRQEVFLEGGAVRADSRHDPGEVEHLSSEVGQVAVQEHEQGLNDADVLGEARGEGGGEPKTQPHQNSSQPNHEEFSNSSKNIHAFDAWHLTERAEELVEHLVGGRKEGKSC